MATTTMGNSDRANRDTTKILYWTIGALAVIALLIFLSMRTFNRTTLSSPDAGAGGYSPPPATDTGTSGTGTDTGTTPTDSNNGGGSSSQPDRR